MIDLLITPYPAYIEYREGKTSSKLFTRARAAKNVVFQTALQHISIEGETEVEFLSPQEGEYEEYVTHPEGYVIQVDVKKVYIYASQPAGYLYAVLTLEQLVKQFPESLPCLLIADKPKWPHRGAQVCYAQMNVEYRHEWLKKFILELARMKINTLYLYMEWRFWFEGIPATHNSYYLDRQGAKEIEEICRAYNIKVVPAINVMGHTADFLGMEMYQELKEYDYERETLLSAPPSALCPNHPKTRELIERALKDLMEAFSSEVIHVGGDEVEKIGVCPLCRPIKEDKGVEYVYVQYFTWICNLLKQENRKMGIWGDMIEHFDLSLLEDLKENTIIYHWSYDGPAREVLRKLKDHGFKIICSTSTQTCKVGALWPGQAVNQYEYFKDGFELECLGGLVTDWINGWAIHAEHSGLNYATAAAFMWQGIGENENREMVRGQIGTAYLFQKYGQAHALMHELIHLLGDANSELIGHFPGTKSGSYLRKAAYLSINPMQVYMHFNQCLEGEKLDTYRKAVEHLEVLWAGIVEKTRDDQWLVFQKQGVILHRYLLNRFEAIHEISEPYRIAAQNQWKDKESFMSHLDQCVTLLKAREQMFEEPYNFIKQCHEVLGLEEGSLWRVQKTQENYQILYKFMEHLKEGHRPLPALKNIATWLFEAPTTGFWEARSDEWYAESEPFRRVDIDGKVEWGSVRW